MLMLIILITSYGFHKFDKPSKIWIDKNKMNMLSHICYGKIYVIGQN